jgi:translation initiation factor 3 subunit M
LIIAADISPEFIAAYNLLVHLIRQSPNLNMFLPKVCTNLSQPISSSPQNGPGMSLAILTTIFNIMAPDNDTRYHVFLAILAVVKRNNLYESVRPQLKNIDRWIAEWESDEEEQRKLFLEIADVAEEAGEEEFVQRSLTDVLRVDTD